MNRMSKEDEARLVKAVEQTITLTNQGVTPNDAIYKVATEANYRPAAVQRIVQAFNKSKAVHHMKTAMADTRADSVELADAQQILQRMYTKPVEKTAEELVLPMRDMSAADIRVDMIAKVASFRVEDPLKKEASSNSSFSTLRKHAQVCEGIRQRLNSDIKAHKYAFDQALDELSDHMSRLDKAQMRKVAQIVVNAFPSTGNKLMRIVSTRMNRPVPELQKMANAAILPPQEPYLTISRVYEHAEKMASAEVKYESFQKAAAITGPFGEAAAGSLVAGLGLSPEDIVTALQRKKKVGELADDLDPVHFNELKGIEAKRTFLDLMLYDKDLQQYDYPELVQAYNDTVGSVPSAFNRPTLLKNLMLKNIQSSGQKDVFELAQEQKIQQGLSKEEEGSRKAIQDVRDRAELRKLRATTSAIQTSKDPGWLGNRAKQVSELLASGGKVVGTATDNARATAEKEIQESEKQRAKELQDKVTSIMAWANKVNKKSIQAAGGEPEVRIALENWLTDPHTSGTNRKRLEIAGIKQPGDKQRDAIGPLNINPLANL